MNFKPIKEWKPVSKLFFMLLGFFLAMFFFPYEKEEAVNAEVSLLAEESDMDFFTQFREAREKRRGEKMEMYQSLLSENGVTQEERQQLLTELELYRERITAEDNVEAILKGRGYDDAIFSYEDGLSLLMIHQEKLPEEEKEQLIQFVTVYSGVQRENLSVFSISA